MSDVEIGAFISGDKLSLYSMKYMHDNNVGFVADVGYVDKAERQKMVKNSNNSS